MRANMATQLKNGFMFIIYLQFKRKYAYTKYIQLKTQNDNGIGVADTDI